MNRRPARTLAAAAALLAAAAVGVTMAALISSGGTKVVRQVTVRGSQPSSSTTLTVGEVYERAHRGVVEITASTSSLGGSQTRSAQGSGFVYARKGHVVTNQHVVDGADSISVRFWNGSTYHAEVVGTDPSTDLAVLVVDAPASILAPLTLGDSGGLAVGDGVVAIGSPFGLEETVTSGIVSALHRQMEAPNGFAITDSIQTDAAINHGNSGGPLLDLHGRVVGVNAQIQSDAGGNDGVGFAIPADTVRSIVSQLLGGGKAEHAYLGVGVATIPASVASQLGLAAGVALAEVRTDTPAAAAGLRAATGSSTVDGQSYPTGGDVVTAVDGEAVVTSAELQAAIDAKRPGDAVSLRVVRDGKTRSVRVELATRPS